VDDIVHKLTDAYNEKEKLERIRLNGRSLIEESFSEAKLIAGYLDKYTHVR
jgi:hypothetical protein